MSTVNICFDKGFGVIALIQFNAHCSSTVDDSIVSRDIPDVSDELLVDRVREQVGTDVLKEESSSGDGGVTEPSGCRQEQCLDTATQLSSAGDDSTWQLEYNSQTTMRDIHNHVSKSED